MGWVISSHITKWLSLVFVICLLILFIGVYTIRYVIERDCTDYYKRDTSAFGYWFTVRIGSTDKGCPDPYKIFR